jgi:hypothetical protein
MELSTKELGTLGGWLISLGSTVAWVRIKIKDHGSRLAKVENRFFTENNEPALLSYRAHKHICDQKDEKTSLQMKHLIDAVNNHSIAVKDNSDQVAQLSTLVAVLEEKVTQR